MDCPGSLLERADAVATRGAKPEEDEEEVTAKVKAEEAAEVEAEETAEVKAEEAAEVEAEEADAEATGGAGAAEANECREEPVGLSAYGFDLLIRECE